ncbi:MAG TPA: polysaccharide deacetylase family protein, partial [Ferruginibacter sp.]|nr:polysaccharide deacetylase family protein [Ferruginibacter sp.]
MSINNDNGLFVISLDFELFWGVWDVTTKEKYGNHILGVKEALPRMLELFERYGIKATFATVGFLFAKDKQELLAYLPETTPAYSNSDYNVYTKEFDSLGNDETDDPYHFGYDLFQQIKQSPHEIATHTFCHYFCLEEGQGPEDFDADIKAAKRIAAANDVKLTSIVFPRNQVNTDYLPVLKDNGINVYRSNPVSWIYKPRKFSAEIIFIRICRLLDTYLPISGYNTHAIKRNGESPVDVPA